jgi:hypothetical protein
MASTSEQYLAYLMRRKQELEGLEMAREVEREIEAKRASSPPRLLSRVRMNGGGTYIHHQGKWQHI